MYRPGQFQCVSFHAGKILADEQGGAILHDNGDADGWFRRARFDGRSQGVAPKDDQFILGYHVYMSPSVAARLLTKLYFLPRHNDDLPNDDYPDLSQQKVFK
jgi:dTDP-4-amino-4,6-dideoxygalactose transaminase